MRVEQGVRMEFISITMKCFRPIFLFLILCSCAQNNELVLGENTLGSIQLDSGISIDQIAVETMDLICTEIKASQDGPDYILKTCNQNGLDLFRVSSYSLTDLKLRNLEVLSDDFPDQYGIRIGSSYDKLKTKRPGLKIEIIHSKIYAVEKGSHIYYLLKIPQYSGPDLNHYPEELLKQSKVVSILWS